MLFKATASVGVRILAYIISAKAIKSIGLLEVRPKGSIYGTEGPNKVPTICLPSTPYKLMKLTNSVPSYPKGLWACWVSPLYGVDLPSTLV